MSLDVYLHSQEKRKNQCGHCGSTYEKQEELYWANITHNLSKMAEEAGIYKALWRPEEINAIRADQIILPLTKGLALLKSDPERFKKLNAPNGWGTYEHFVPFVEEYLNACKENPYAIIEVSR